MEQMEQLESVPGNTESGTLPKSGKSRGWFLTFNNPDDIDVEQLISLFKTAGVVAYMFQLEMGEENTPHYQGCVYFKNPVTMPKYIDPRIHWEYCHNWRAATNYCCKPETRIAGPWYEGVKPPKAKLEVIEPSGWQLDIVEIIRSKPDLRTIHWFWESTGNVGKTQFTKWIMSNFNGLVVGGKAADAKYAVAQYVKHRQLEVVVFDLPRCNDNHISYEALESIKNGMFFSGKYEGQMVLYNSPHVIVFANVPPEKEKLSQDRWHIVEIGSEHEVTIWA